MHETASFVVKPQTSPERQEFYGRLDRIHTAPLWEVLNLLVVPEPNPAIVPALLKYDDVRALLMEAGRPYVFVQTGGESFARRYVEIATRDRDLIGVRSGVKPGERVVTRGAYDVQLASAASGLPAEGHVH